MTDAIDRLREISSAFEARGHKTLPHGLTGQFDLAEVIFLARFAREVLEIIEDPGRERNQALEDAISRALPD